MRHGWLRAARSPLAGDASFRRYERITEQDRCAVLMDAPPDREDIVPFIDVDEQLCRWGLSAPKILARDVEEGLLLLEDLGDDLYSRVLKHSDDKETELYEAAVDVLIHIAGQSEGLQAPAYDDEKLLRESELFCEWYLPQVVGGQQAAAISGEFMKLVEALLPVCRRVPDCLVLRDYHADNLLWLPDRENNKRVGLLDFQDAVIGPVTYDLVSLLEDARRDVKPETVKNMLQHFSEAFPAMDEETFKASYAAMGAQRNLKIIGIFVRLCVRDGKPHYLDYLPRVWNHLEQDIEHPELEALKSWINTHIPVKYRGKIVIE